MKFIWMQLILCRWIYSSFYIFKRCRCKMRNYKMPQWSIQCPVVIDRVPIQRSFFLVFFLSLIFKERRSRNGLFAWVKVGSNRDIRVKVDLGSNRDIRVKIDPAHGEVTSVLISLELEHHILRSCERIEIYKFQPMFLEDFQQDESFLHA